MKNYKDRALKLKEKYYFPYQYSITPNGVEVERQAFQHQILVHGDTLIIGDCKNKGIHLYDLEGKHISSIWGGKDLFYHNFASTSLAFALDASALLWVSDIFSQKIHSFDTKGGWKGCFEFSYQDKKYFPIGVFSMGDELWVSSYPEMRSQDGWGIKDRLFIAVKTKDPQKKRSLKFIDDVGVTIVPTDMAQDKEGNIYCVDTVLRGIGQIQCVWKFDSDHKFIAKKDLSKTMKFITGMVYDTKAHHFYFLDPIQNKVFKFDGELNFIWGYHGPFHAIHHITIHKNALYIADYHTNKIYVHNIYTSTEQRKSLNFMENSTA